MSQATHRTDSGAAVTAAAGPCVWNGLQIRAPRGGTGCVGDQPWKRAGHGLHTLDHAVENPDSADRQQAFGDPAVSTGSAPRQDSSSHLNPEVTVFDSEAVIDHEGDARLGGARLRRRIHDALLQPDQWRLERNRLIHDGTRELAAAKHVHDVDGVIARRIGERTVALLAEDCVMPRIHRNNFVSRPLEIARDGIAGPRRVGGQSHHGDGARRAEQGADSLFFGGCHDPRLCTCGVPLTARPTSTIPERSAMVTASVDGTLGVATQASPARAALNANSAEIRPVTSSPRSSIGVRASTAAPITLSTALCRPMSSA